MGEFGSHHEQSKLQTNFASLGAEFNVGFDYLLEDYDLTSYLQEQEDKDADLSNNFPPDLLNKNKTLNEKAFLDKLAKLGPAYLDHIKRLMKKEVDHLEEMNEFYKNSKLKKEELSDKESKKPLVDLTLDFIKKIEVFSREPKEIEIGILKTAAEYEAELQSKGFRIGDYTRDNLLNSQDFAKSLEENKEPQKVDTVRLKVRDLFTDNKSHTFEEIRKKAKELLDLDVCPPEVGPAYRLAYPANKQPMNEWLRIAMEPISDPGRHLSVFHVGRHEGGAWLSNHWVSPMYESNPDFEFVFRLPSSPVPASET